MPIYNRSTGKQLQVFSRNCYSMTLQANVEQTLEVPNFTSGGLAPSQGSFMVVRFAIPYNGNVWIAINNTAEVANASVDESSSELFTGASPDTNERLVRVGDVIHFITSDTSTIVGVTFLQDI